MLRRAYDISPDGDRFLFVRESYPPAVAELDRIHLVQNWFEELKRLVPTD